MKYSSDDLRPLLRKIGLKQTDIAEAQRRDGYTNHKERVLRVLSWLSAAEKYNENSDYDVCLMCAWAAFNGLYAKPYNKEVPKQEDANIKDIINDLIDCDKKSVLLEYLLQNEYKWKKILINQYLYPGYWKEWGKWKSRYEDSNKEVNENLLAGKYGSSLAKHVKCPLEQIMLRVKVLRNQLMHGEAGYNDYYNRWQVEACANFLPPLVGCMLKIMIDNADFSWGEVPYPPQCTPNAHADKVTFLESENGQNKKRN